MTRNGIALAVVAAVGITAIAAATIFRDVEWETRLSPVGGSTVSGKVEMESEGAQRTDVEIDIRGATPGDTHPWHVHIGSCGNDQGIFGAATDYPPLVVRRNGEAEADARIALATPTSGEYFVNVHKSADDLKTIVACGDLRRKP